MTANRKGACAVLLAGIALALYYATKNTPGDIKVPENQRESQMMGMNVQAGQNYGTPGGPLDMSPDIHFWAPGWTNSGRLVDDHPVVQTPHRYPAVPGGNLSTVMHHGWASLMENQPAERDWWLNPPELAVT